MDVDDRQGEPELVVRRWTAGDDGEPQCVEESWATDDEGMWRSTLGGATGVDLATVIAPRPEDITCIGIEDPDVVSTEELAAALPRDRSHLRGACELVGSDLDLPWELADDTSRTVVLVDEERWAPFAVGVEDVVWLRCDREELECGRIQPALDALLVGASGIELGSMTSGVFWWGLGVVGDLTCWLGHPDEDEAWCELEPIAGRPLSDLARGFARSIDWNPVSAAAVLAVETKADVRCFGSDLDDDWSDSLELAVSVDPAIWTD